MKKIIIIVACILLLGGCQKSNNHENRFDNNPNLRTDLEMYNEEMDKVVPNCFDICHKKIPDLCVDEIVEYEDQDIYYGDSVKDEDFCDGICDSWTDDTKRCMAKAKKCDSITSREPYCKEEEDDSAIEYEPEKEVNYNCTKACYKYKECALLTDDATAQDGNEAYQTCFEECQNWSQKTVKCVSDTETGTPMGCTNMTACALKEYNKYLK